MKQLFLLTKKNIRHLLRAKSSALLVLFAPLLLILIVGLSFSGGKTFAFSVGVVAPGDSPDISAFKETLKQENFTTVSFTTAPECIEALKLGNVDTCVELPGSFQVVEGKSVEVAFHVDESRSSVVSRIETTMQEKFNLQAQQISENLAQDIISKLTTTKEEVSAQSTALNTLKEKNAGLIEPTQKNKQDLSTLDFTPPTLPDTKALGAFETHIVTAVQTSMEKVNLAKSKVASANFTNGDKTGITAALSTADSALRGALDKFNDTTSQDSFRAVHSTVNVLYNDLSKAAGKLQNASNAVNAAATNLGSLETTLIETRDTLAGVQSTLASIEANLANQKAGAGVIAQPLVTKVNYVAQTKTHLTTLFPPLLVLIIMFSSLLLGTILVMMEKNSPAFIRNFFLPVKKSTFILSTYLTTLILIFAQLVIILGIALIFLPEFYVTLPALSVVLFLTASIFIFIGMSIGHIFKSEETGIIASVSVGSLLLFISGIILPVEGVRAGLRSFIEVNPYVVAEQLVRKIFIFQSHIADIWVDAAVLIGYALFFFLVILFAEYVLHHKLAHKSLKRHHKHRENDQKGKQHKSS